MTKCSCHAHNGFLTAKGLEEAAQRERMLPGVADMALSQYLDKEVSVSGMLQDEIWDASLIEEQYRRFHNGS